MDTEEERRALQRKLRQMKQEASSDKKRRTLSTRDTWQHDGDDEVGDGDGDGGTAEGGAGSDRTSKHSGGGGAKGKDGWDAGSNGNDIQAIDFCKSK